MMINHSGLLFGATLYNCSRLEETKRESQYIEN